jgi:hypothetical protein
MPLVVTQTTPPAAQPVTLAQAKSHLRITWTNDDAYVTTLIAASSQYCQVLAKRTFVNTGYTMVDDAFPFTMGSSNRQIRQFYGQFQGGQGAVYPGVLALNSGIITFPRAPVVSVQSVVYLDANGVTQTWSPSNYVVTPGAPGRMSPTFGTIWPVTLPVIGAVSIQFTAGYGPDGTTVVESDQQAVLMYLGHLWENREAVGVAMSECPMGVVALLGIGNNSGGYM